jgi:protease-4
VKPSSFLRSLARIIGRINPFRLLRRTVFTVANWRRGRAKLDYIQFALAAELPPLPEPRGFIQRRLFGPPPLSLAELDRHFQQIGEDPRVKGVILVMAGFAMPLAQLQSLRMSIQRLRARDKRVICYAQDYDTAAYYVASAADEIILQPGGVLFTLGLSQGVVFFRDALDTLGLGLDVVAISPYKSALETFVNREFTPENRAQLEWLLDSRYDQIIEAIADSRGIDADAARARIDGAPYIDRDALSAGMIDHILHEDALPKHLAAEHLIPWKQAEKRLLRRWRKRSRQYVALLNLSGTIIQGKSRNPPPLPLPIPLPFAGDDMLGDETVVAQVRQLIEDDAAKAVILYIDSPGGSSAASEAMTAALDQLARTRPVVAYMAGVAASGGYYVATPARWIIAQPGTITGSIGVIFAKLVAGEALDKLRLNRVDLERGANIGLMSEAEPLSDQERAAVRRIIERTYEQFVERVAASRAMTPEAVDAVGGGRVWTGAQALGHGLIDELGDLNAALSKARALAELDDDAPLVWFEGDDEETPPAPAEAIEELNPAAALLYAHQAARLVFNGRPQMLLPFWLK